MPAHRKRPTPPARMVELLTAAKRDLLRAQGVVTEGDFDAAWDAAWALMVAERAWPHATEHRREWRAAMLQAMRPEARACFLDRPTGFSRFATSVLLSGDLVGMEFDDVMVGRLVA